MACLRRSPINSRSHLANDFLNSIGVSTHITQGVDNPTNVDTAPVQTLSNVSAIPLIFSDHPVIIEVSPVISSVKEVKRENAALATVYTSLAEALLHVENRQVLKKIELLDLTGKTVLQLSDVSAGSTQLDLAHVQKGGGICFV